LKGSEQNEGARSCQDPGGLLAGEGVVMARSTLGLFVGLALAFALVFGGFGDMLIVALFGAVGFVVPKVVDGELDLAPYLSRLRGDR